MMDTTRDDILSQLLSLAAFDGWTNASLKQAAQNAGLCDDEVRQSFPGGAIDAVEYFFRRAEERMLEQLQQQNLPEMKIREQIAQAVWIWLEQNLPHREAIRRALGVYATPPHTGRALSSLYHTADVIWQAAGDTSTDYNRYTKRLMLSGVFSSTVLAWLDDLSPGQEATRAFLYRRIENVMQIQKARARFQGWCRSPQSFVSKSAANQPPHA